VDVELLIRGALLARDKELFLENKEDKPNDIEKRALEREEHPKLFQQPKALLVVIWLCCIGAIVQGWSQTNITGANLGWPDELGLPNVYSNSDSNAPGKDYWAFGGVNSVMYFTASLVGGWMSDPLTEHVFGRRGALFMAGVFTLASSIGSGYVQTWKQLLACRALQGLGMGAKAAVIPIYESEVSPPGIRGRLLVSWQAFTAIGIFFGASANLIFRGNWRWQLAIAFVPTIPLLCIVPICCE